ncbi:MAG: LuxR C-terminal-related transcriptional regulator [Methylobacter sp.]|nr:LuxR C-terminal-related transcriptional regulator [Methylobacter sp.]
MKYAKKYTALQLPEYCISTQAPDATIVQRLLAAQTQEELMAAIEQFALANGLQAVGHASGVAGQLQINFLWATDKKIPDYTQEYGEQGLDRIDPLLHLTRREILPIHWGLREHRINMDEKEKPWYGLQDAYQIKRGMVIPVHDPNGFSMFCTTVPDNDHDFQLRLPELTGTNLMIASFIHDAVRRIILAGNKHQSPFKPLTNREIECLHWAAAGKSAWETSVLLGIAQSTVVFHHENAKRKLQAKTLMQALARSVALGLVHP